MLRRKRWRAFVGFAGWVAVSLLSAQPARAIYLDDEKTLFLAGVFYNQWRVRTEEPLRFNTQVGDWTTLQHRYFVDPQLRVNVLPWLRNIPGGADLAETLQLNESRFFFNPRFEYDGIYDYGPEAFSDALPPQLQKGNRFQLFEVYGDLRLFNRLSLRIGRQNLSWGETDGFRLLDRINPLDASFGGFLIPLDERRRPLTMLRATLGLPEPAEWGITNTAFEVFIAPDKRLPVAGAPAPTPWGTGGAFQPPESTPTLIGSLIALGRFDVTLQNDRPDLSFTDSRMGVRLLWVWHDISFSLAHLSTYPDAPTPSLQLGRTGNPVLKLRFPNIQVTGATASGPVSAINVPVLRNLTYTIFRTEVAGFFGEPYFIEQQNFALGQPLPKRNAIRGVLGFDHNQWIRSLHPESTFFFTGQLFYTNIQGSLQGIKLPIQYHSGRFLDVDAEGGIIDKATGQRPWPLPYGRPFPQIDVNEDPKKVGAKIHWNQASVHGIYGDFDGIGWVGSAPPQGPPNRYFLINVFGLFIDFRRDPIQTAVPLSWQQTSIILEPSDAFGTTTLTWRWADPKKWDSVWAYSPQIRRVRRVTAANRSDSLLGTEVTLDDGNGYDGKIEMADWKYVGKQEMLMPFVRAQSQPLDDFTIKLPYTTKPSSRYSRVPAAFETDDRRVTFGYQEDPQRYVSWWYTDLLWAVVPAYVSEIVPKDPYYNYGRQILWYEANTNNAVWKLIYNRSGEYWRTEFLLEDFAQSNASGKLITANRTSIMAMSVDDKLNRGSMTLNGAQGRGAMHYNIGLEPDMFSMERFLQFGK